MKATFAFPADAGIHNLVRKLCWDVHQKYRTGLKIARLMPHISIKQPFNISAPDLLAGYMIELARDIKPFRVKLTHLEMIEATIDGLVTGILWLNVEETAFLRQLHDRVNRELAARFGDVSAPFDGPEYHFHMTVALDRQPVDVYRKIHGEFSDRLHDLQYTVRDIALFAYDDRDDMDAGYITYMIQPLGFDE